MSIAPVQRRPLTDSANRTHRLEEVTLYGEEPSPLRELHSDSTFTIAIGLEGQSRWQLSLNECTLRVRQLIAFVTDPKLLVSRKHAETSRFLLWRFSMEKMNTIRKALGEPGTQSAATCQVKGSPFVGPFELTLTQQSLILSLRCAPPTPLQNLWYGAKLLELFAILQPPMPDGIAKPSSLHAAVRRTLGTLHSDFINPPVLSEIAAKAGVSTNHLSRLFVQETGMTVSAYLRQLRLEHASHLLLTGDCNVTETALAVGYSSLAQFSAAFRKTYGHTPGHHRRLLKKTGDGEALQS